MLCLYIVNKLKFEWEVKIVFHWGRNIQTLPRAHKCPVPPLRVHNSALGWNNNGSAVTLKY
jgi:hypothetical protein